MRTKLNNTLQLSDKQLEVIQHALEIYDRLSGGQPDIAIETLRDSNKMSGIPNRLEAMNAADATYDNCLDNVENAWLRMYKHNDPRRSSNSASWTQRPEGLDPHYDNPALIAREVMQTIRRDRSLRIHPEGGHTTNFNEPLKNTKEPLPILTQIK